MASIRVFSLMFRWQITLLLLMAVSSVGSFAADTQPEFQFSLEQVKKEFSVHQRKESGTVFYECQIASCGQGSTVSQHPQDSTYPPDLNGLESNFKDWLGGIDRAFPDKQIHGEVLRTSLGEFQNKSGESKLSYALELVRLSSENGSLGEIETWWTIGFLTDGHGSMTFASSSTERDMAWRNANGILAFTASFTDK